MTKVRDKVTIMHKTIWVAAAASLLCACGEQAAAEDGAWLRREIERARDGATINVPSGDYDMSDVTFSKDLTLVGPPDRSAVLRAANVTDKGVLVPTGGANLTIENLTFKDVTAWDRNGAGVRFEGRNLTVVNCLFDGNEDGILATGDDSGVIRIRNSDFIDSGFGDGQSHGVYVDGAALVEVTDSRFIGTRIGHHLKSVAQKTVVTGSFFDDARGRTSYAIDMPAGGEAIIRGNTLVQSVDSDNWAIFNYDLGKGGAPVSLTIEGNKVTNHYHGGVLFRNDTRIKPVVRDNEIDNKGRAPLKIQ
ncbi:MAG: hypothetical protein GC152_15810 [Alphaproteobacteria bacterium]|nr:hypothetical protein [Alphaproteobacteria bacterium]